MLKLRSLEREMLFLRKEDKERRVKRVEPPIKILFRVFIVIGGSGAIMETYEGTKSDSHFLLAWKKDI